MPSSKLPDTDGDEANPAEHRGPAPRLDASDADFAALRALFRAHCYDVEAICARTGSPSIYDFRMRAHGRAAAAPEQGIDALINLYLDHRSMPPEEVDRLLGRGSVALLSRLGLLEVDGECVVGTALLYPSEGVYMISDPPAFSDTGGVLPGTATDLVYPAITNSVRTFVSTLPTAPGARFLELCSGTGVAALIAARRGSADAWAIDITARSTHYAAFNARMNGLANVHARQGDLYEPVKGSQFDCIVAHPPYVPSTKTEFIYRDGGEDGEQISRAILGGVPEYLAPGGIFHCTCMISARTNAPPARRIREMIGPAHDEFDMVLLTNGVTDLVKHYSRVLLATPEDRVLDVLAQLRHFKEMGVERIEFCTIILRRHGEPRSAVTIVAQRDARTTWAEVEWLFGLQQIIVRGDAALDQLLTARPRLSALAQFRLGYRVDHESDDVWAASDGEVLVSYPVPGRVPANAGDAAFLASCTGARTFAELWRDNQANGNLPADVTSRQFMRTVLPMVTEGVLETDLLPFPTSSSPWPA